MTIHICRDFQTLSGSTSPGTSMYLVALFLQHVMQFDVDSHKNFDLDSSTFTKGRFDVNEANLSYASINLLGSENIVYLPANSYIPTGSDVNRILALRSSNFPRHNSGLFRILSSSNHPTLGLGLTIDYRSTEFPQQESGSLAWRIYEAESGVSSSWLSGSNGSSGYASRGTANNTRLMLNAPQGYHVRLCLESTVDTSSTVDSGFSIAPGAGSVDGADFDDFEGHLHGPMWFNSRSETYRGFAVGLTPHINGTAWSSGQWRFTAIGDDLVGNVTFFTRNVSFLTGGNGWCSFGNPEDPSADESDEQINRVYVVGYGNQTPNITWHSGFQSEGHAQGTVWSRYGYPVPCLLSSYADIRNGEPHIRLIPYAGPNPFSNTIELVDVLMLAGTTSSSLGPLTSSVAEQAPFYFGRLPLVRQGAANYTQWATTPDKAWLHIRDGLWIPWAGPYTSDLLTGSYNAELVMTSSYSSGDGLQFFEPDPPMTDPGEETFEDSTVKDANRFRKTYSYYRQQTVEVRVVKDGSSPSKH